MFANEFTQSDLLPMDPQFDMMSLNMGFNLNVSLDFNNMMPIVEEESTPSEIPTPLGNFQYLDIPTESSREGSSTTPGGPDSSQSFQTPVTVPEEEEVMVHYGMVSRLHTTSLASNSSVNDS
jgi:hypothetical protein